MIEAGAAPQAQLPQGMRILFSVPKGVTEQAISEAFYAAGVVVPVDAISLRVFPDHRVSCLMSVPSEEILRLLQWALQDATLGGQPIKLRGKPNHRAGRQRT